MENLASSKSSLRRSTPNRHPGLDPGSVFLLGWSMAKRYVLPDCLSGKTDQVAYERWLRRRATACVRRDRKRCDWPITGEAYRLRIHEAVKRSGAVDHYTGEELRWDLISAYSNVESKAGRSSYKAKFALLPTVDHVPGADGEYDFVICAWCTNDAKNDMSHSEFVDLCQRVIMHQSSRADT
jgi:hypothetical protein